MGTNTITNFKSRAKNMIKHIPVVGWIVNLILLRKNMIKLVSRTDELLQMQNSINNNLTVIKTELRATREKLIKHEEVIMQQEKTICGLGNVIDKHELVCSKLKEDFSQIEKAIKSNSDDAKNSLEEVQKQLSVLDAELKMLEDAELPQVLKTNGVLNKESYYTVDNRRNEEKITDSFLESYYLNLGKLFRSDETILRKRLESYIEYFKNEDGSLRVNKPVLDIGCGTGLFLDVLEESGIDAVGVDSNLESINEAKAKGHTVFVGDANSFLEEEPDDKYSAITMIEVAEHISFESMVGLCRTILRKISDGGCFIMETINPYCYTKFGTFRLDPSHIQYPSPDAYKLLLEMVGFSSVDMYFYAPIEHPKKKEINICNYEGYYLVARK